MVHIDIKAASDSVDRSALWLGLKGVGISDVLLNLVKEGAYWLMAFGCVSTQSQVCGRLHSYTGTVLSTINWILGLAALHVENKIG